MTDTAAREALVAALRETARAIFMDGNKTKSFNAIYKTIIAAADALEEQDRLLDERRGLIRHCQIRSGYPDCGYDQMTTPQKALYDNIRSFYYGELDAPAAVPANEYVTLDCEYASCKTCVEMNGVGTCDCACHTNAMRAAAVPGPTREELAQTIYRAHQEWRGSRDVFPMYEYADAILARFGPAICKETTGLGESRAEFERDRLGQTGENLAAEATGLGSRADVDRFRETAFVGGVEYDVEALQRIANEKAPSSWRAFSDLKYSTVPEPDLTSGAIIVDTDGQCYDGNKRLSRLRAQRATGAFVHVLTHEEIQTAVLAPSPCPEEGGHE